MVTDKGNESKIYQLALGLAQENGFEFTRISPAKLMYGTLQHFTTRDITNDGDLVYHYGYHSILQTLNRIDEYEEEEVEEEEEEQEDYEFTVE
jgi:hypothetical protein